MMVIDPKKRIKPDEALKHPFFIRSTPTSDTTPSLSNTASKTTVFSLQSTSCDKNLISMAAASKIGGNVQSAKATDGSGGERTVLIV